MTILLTTTSFQETTGEHHRILAESGFEIVRASGPLDEQRMLSLTSGRKFDGLLCGDDQITARVIDTALPRLKVIAKYGIGLDSIDVPHATARKIPVLFTPGVNHTTVAEHAFGLMISLAKHFWPHMRSVRLGQWKRTTGIELAGKTIGILGLGRVGKEVAVRARAFGMNVIAFDPFWDEAFAAAHQITRCPAMDDCLRQADVLTLHLNLTDETRHCINADRIARMKPGAMIINTARGALVNEADIAAACKTGRLWGYGADVLEHEPITVGHPFLELDNIALTPHIGSRTAESVQRQGVRAASNLVNFLTGKSDFIQANKFQAHPTLTRP